MINDSEKQKDEYRTKDLYEAAFLYSNNARLVRLDEEGRQYWFVFNEIERCKELSNSYWSGDGVVKAISLVDSIRKLKDRIFAQR